MDVYQINGLSFKYEDENEYALKDVSLNISQGDFVLLCGKSGCGKSTLLRMLKHSLAPVGKKDGIIMFKGKELDTFTPKELAQDIGFVMQNPDNQLVYDDVYGELCFGMSQLGYEKKLMGRKVFEIANYFGINHYLDVDINNLSGGQKQLVTVAGALCTSPSVLLLDEPASSLDTNSAELLIASLEKLNKELGMTIIIAEQKLDKIYFACNKVILMEKGKVRFACDKKNIGKNLLDCEHKGAFPAYVQAYSELEGKGDCPRNMNEGQRWFRSFQIKESMALKSRPISKNKVLTGKNLWMRFEKNSRDVLKGVDISLLEGEISCLLGANGSGKTTLLKVISGIKRCYEGKVSVKGKTVAVSQNPVDIFSKMTMAEEFSDTGSYLFDLFELRSLLGRHPYDLSGGELQRMAVVKALLEEPDVLLLDEVTKGMGIEFKDVLGKELIKRSEERGLSVILSSHDIDFCAEYTDTCRLLFNGSIVTTGNTKEIIMDNEYYTTQGRILTREIVDNVITNKDVMELCRRLKTK